MNGVLGICHGDKSSRSGTSPSSGWSIRFESCRMLLTQSMSREF
jgi:hypothetical protein